MKRQHRVLAGTHFFTFLHHLFLATTISSLLLALHATPWYPLLDNLTYSVMASRRPANEGQAPGAGAPSASWDVEKYPLVVILGPEVLYAERLKVMQTRLVRQIEGAVPAPRPGEGPRVLGVVMDLAPLSYDVLEDKLRDQSRLDRALDEARLKMLVVLLVPNVGDDPVGRERFRWLVARCRAGIEFGLREPRAMGQLIYGYWSNIESVGVLAGKLASGRHASRNAVLNVCETAKKHEDVTEFIEEMRARMPERSLAHELPLNKEYFDFDGNIEHVGSVMPARRGVAPALPLRALGKARAIFVGLDESERGMLGGEPILPADLYAAEFFTERYPVRPLRLWHAFVLDVGLGFILGYVFAFLWEWYARAAARLEATPLYPLRRKLLMYLAVRGGLLGLNLAVLVLVLWGCVRMAGAALSYSLWLNPLPIVLGMSIDGLLHSRHRPDTEEPHDLKGFLTKHFDVLAQGVIIVLALGWVAVYSIRTTH